jgi:hypothetical protein
MGREETNPTHRPQRIALVTLLSFVLSLVALTTPVSARKAPKKSGPLSFDDRKCDRERELWRDPKTSLVETVAKTETCVLFYRFDPLAERNEKRDYGIAWAQGKVSPRNGWCARRVTSHVLVSSDGKMHARAPRKDLEIGTKRRLRVRLATDANGTSGRTGSLAETITVWPRLLKHSVIKRDGAHIFRQHWRGLRGRSTLFASGVVLSWAEDPENFPDAISSGLSYKFEKRGICR